MKAITALLGGCVIAASICAIAFAQTSFSFSGTCSKADLMQTVPAGDKPNHSFAITRGRCSTNDTIGGESGGSGAWADQEEIMGNRTKAKGVYTETFASGDKIFYGYKQVVKTKGNAFVSGSAEFKVIGGTGKLAGMKAKGKCTFTPAADEAVNFSCTGSYGSAAMDTQ